MQDLMLDTHKKICFGTNNEAPRQLGFKRDLMKFILQSGGWRRRMFCPERKQDLSKGS